MILVVIGELVGAVALLMWGLHMVQTGMQRAFGNRLRSLLAHAISNRLSAFAAGTIVTMALQSSTATSLMITGFLGTGALELVPALAIMLGANLGSSLTVQLLSFPVAALAPLPVAAGVFMFQHFTGVKKDLGRAVIGIGLMLIALHQLVTTLQPAAKSPVLSFLIGQLSDQPVLAAVIAGTLAWISHSSVAAALLVLQLATNHVINLPAALAMLLGANLGSAINPVLEGPARLSPLARRLPLAILAIRFMGVLAAAPWIADAARLIPSGLPATSGLIAMAYTGFNVVLTLICLPLLPQIAGLTVRLIKIPPPQSDGPVYLQKNASSFTALGTAQREALRLADGLDAMLEGFAKALQGGDRQKIAETKRMDDLLDMLSRAITRHIAELGPSSLTVEHQKLAAEILAFVKSLEQAGDLVDKRLLGLARKASKRSLLFTEEQETGMLELVAKLRENNAAAAAIFLSRDARAARRLAAEIDTFRDYETAAVRRHFIRLSDGQLPTETSSLYLEILRDLRRVNSHLVEAAAYPVLVDRDELLSTRLREA
jgi:phosphate:Na+ symporter